jgi:hypothetical protein
MFSGLFHVQLINPAENTFARPGYLLKQHRRSPFEVWGAALVYRIGVSVLSLDSFSSCWNVLPWSGNRRRRGAEWWQARHVLPSIAAASVGLAGDD